MILASGTQGVDTAFITAAVYLLVVIVGGGLVLAGARWLGGQLAYSRQQRREADIRTMVTASTSRLSEQLTVLQASMNTQASELVALREQFGPNGGGLRQQVDAISATVERLEAAFEEHLRAGEG